MPTNPYQTKMVDLQGQYHKIKNEVDAAVLQVMEDATFIKGPAVTSFENHLSAYLGVKHVISCANGTDALQLALMALDLKPEDEVILPSFTFIATAEVVGLLGFRPVLVDVDPHNFNMTAKAFKNAITKNTKAVMPVHLFGQGAPMEEIMEIALKNNIAVIEDNAQAIGADYLYKDGTKKKLGTIGHIGCTSFFPSKNLGAFGDGGAIFTDDDGLAAKMRELANHGMTVRYHHDYLGVNSRLDSMQAAILDIKLKHLDSYAQARYEAAQRYTDLIHAQKLPFQTPVEETYSTHVYHQYTIKTEDISRDGLTKQLAENEIPYGIYYPIPIHRQKAFEKFYKTVQQLPVSDKLCKQVISLPMHTELKPEEQKFIIDTLAAYF